MKKRSCFVSNSSSSSFVIASKEYLTDKTALKVFKTPQDSVLYPLAVQMSKLIVGRAEGGNSFEEWLSEEGLDRDDLLWRYGEQDFKLLEEVGKKGRHFYFGAFSAEEYSDYGAETVLNFNGFDYDDDEILFFKEEG